MCFYISRNAGILCGKWDNCYELLQGLAYVPSWIIMMWNIWYTHRAVLGNWRLSGRKHSKLFIESKDGNDFSTWHGY